MRPLSLALLPGVSALAVGLAVVVVPALRAGVTAFLDEYPILLPGVGVMLALVYRRRRALYALVVLALAAWTWGLLGGGDEELVQAVYGCASLLLPANFLALAILRERSVWSVAGVVGLAAIALQPLLVAYAWHAYLVEALQAPWREFLPPAVAFSSSLPHISLATFAAALVALAARTAVTNDPLDGGILAASVAALWGMAGGAYVAGGQTWLAVGALAIVFSLVAASARWAFTDPLTGLPGRRACEEALAQLGGVFTLAMVDVDRFKGINDQYGHAAGDQVLRLVAARLAEVGGSGRAFRYGGEEFLVLFPNRELEKSLPFLETVHRAIGATPFRLRGADRPRRKPKGAAPRSHQGPAVTVTVSMGVAASNPIQPRPVGEVVRAADAALYRAKAEGRNRICSE